MDVISNLYAHSMYSSMEQVQVLSAFINDTYTTLFHIGVLYLVALGKCIWLISITDNMLTFLKFSWYFYAPS